MSGPQGKDGGGDGGEKPAYGQYQFDLYAQAIMAGKKPIVTTDPNKLEQAARDAMNPEAFNYVFGGAGEQATMHANRLAFRQWKVIPRMLRPTLPRDLSVKLFGQTYDTPILMAPIGVQGAYHPDGEKGVATACASLNVPFIYSTASTTPLEDVAAAADRSLTNGDEDATTTTTTASQDDKKTATRRAGSSSTGPSDTITASLLARARAAGCTVLVVTLDTFTMSWRPLDLDGGGDPAFRAQFAAQSGGDAVEDNPIMASRAWLAEVFSGHAHGWGRPGDAAAAVGTGRSCSRGWTGRCRAGGFAEIVEAVGDKLTVLFDSGIRTGVDVLKALALGARPCLLGGL
ncbi:hypothetical protein NEMBOFW57_002383 [Staphylotrichum longicolle]|uniref:FMN hydroxy acid dehydrogenase domain-containing protein n=1 Tax=Staphylotrichum longicolle TaxID=669026 RepID=A0AAD4F2V8_9PEZI|nr:hypothetical protein NEMBOFW57_002383 [Staphylotrichum longicolle]